MYAVQCVAGLLVEQPGKINDSHSRHQADAVIQWSAPHIIESYGRVAGRHHPGSGMRWIVRIDGADDYIDPFCGRHGRHGLQVVGGTTHIALKKIVPPSHDHNGFGRRVRDRPCHLREHLEAGLLAGRCGNRTFRHSHTVYRESRFPDSRRRKWNRQRRLWMAVVVEVSGLIRRTQATETAG